MNKGIRTYNMNFKVMVVNKGSNNLRSSRKYGVPEVNIRLQRKDLRKYKNANFSIKSVSGPRKGMFMKLSSEC